MSGEDIRQVASKATTRLLRTVRDRDIDGLRDAIADLEDLVTSERAIHQETINRAEQAEAAIARVRALHSEIPYKPGSCYCANAYPCPTIRVLDGEEAPHD